MRVRFVEDNGERITENGERRTENGERRTENGERRTENGERIERIRVLAIVLGKGISNRAEVAVQGERGFAPRKVPPMEVAREYKRFLSYSQQPHLTVSNK